MFTGKINGVRLLADGNVTVMFTCNGDDLESIAKSRKGIITMYSEGESQVTDDRAVSLAHIRSLAEQVAEAIDRELNGCEINNDELPYNEPYRDLLTEGVKDEQE